MSDQSTRRVRIDEVSGLFKRDGAFVETSHGGRQKDGNFVAWGRANFREVVPELPPPAQPEPSGEAEHQSEEAQAQNAATQEAAALAAAEAAAQAAAPPPPPPPPPVEQDPPPSADEILAAIEAAREEGRANGYAQGLAAARQELSEAVLSLRSMESELVLHKIWQAQCLQKFRKNSSNGSAALPICSSAPILNLPFQFPAMIPKL